MFTVVIPTIWSPPLDFIDKNIEILSNSELVKNIILINNKYDKNKNRYSGNLKVTELCFDNIYVNQAWNTGVSISNTENICLMNDDVMFNTDVFKFIQDSFDLDENVKLVGVCKSSYTLENDEQFTLEKISVRNKGWGCLIFTKKHFYTPIPSDLKIHFGDDYLIKEKEGSVYKLKGLKVISQISTSINSDEKFLEIIKQDNINSLKYHLPWSNDY